MHITAKKKSLEKYKEENKDGLPPQDLLETNRALLP